MFVPLARHGRWPVGRNSCAAVVFGSAVSYRRGAVFFATTEQQEANERSDQDCRNSDLGDEGKISNAFFNGLVFAAVVDVYLVGERIIRILAACKFVL